MVLVEDQPQATDPIIFGAPDLGWAGDPKMAVYYWPRLRKYVLVRLCEDSDYRVILEFGNDHPLSPASVNRVVRRLVEHDARRGFDAHKAILDHNAKLDLQFEKRNEEWVNEEIAPRLAWAYGRDQAGHLGGGFSHTTVPNVPWHGESEAS